MPENIQKIIKNILRDIAVDMKDEFDQNFERQAFFSEKWQRRKSPIRDKGRAILFYTPDDLKELKQKRVLRTLSGLGFDALGEFDAAAIRSLDRHGLVQGAYVEGYGVEDARLTTMGKAYLMDNPKLRNPLDWKWIAAIATIILFIIGCALIKGHVC